MNNLQIAGVVIGGLVGLVTIWAKVLRPSWRWFQRVSTRVSGALDNIGGRSAFHDSATGKLVPAIPPLGERLTGMEATLETLANVNDRLNLHEGRLAEHDSAIAAILANTIHDASEKQLRAEELKSRDVIEGEVEP